MGQAKQMPLSFRAAYDNRVGYAKTLLRASMYFKAF